MRLITALVMTIAIAFGQATDASPRTDAEYIVESFFEKTPDALSQFAAGTYASILGKELIKHSVTVLDEDRFAALLPDALLTPWENRVRQLLIETLAQTKKPAEHLRYVEFLKASEQQPDMLNDPKYRDLQIGLGAGISFIFLKIGLQVTEEMRETPVVLSDHPFLADILENKGLFRFPNPIYRKDLIAKIRTGS